MVFKLQWTPIECGKLYRRVINVENFIKMVIIPATQTPSIHNYIDVMDISLENTPNDRQRSQHHLLTKHQVSLP